MLTYMASQATKTLNFLFLNISKRLTLVVKLKILHFLQPLPASLSPILKGKQNIFQRILIKQMTFV